MQINNFKTLGNYGAYSKFTYAGGELDQLDIYDIPLKAGSSIVSILDADKELVFSGFDVIRGDKDFSYLFLDDLNLTLDSGEYFLYIRQPVAKGHYTYQNEGIWEPEIPVAEVSEPMTLALVALGILALIAFRRK